MSKSILIGRCRFRQPAKQRRHRRRGAVCACKGKGYNAAAVGGRMPAGAGKMKAKRTKRPKQLAILDADLCTGCEACAAVCPAGCVDRIEDSGHPGYNMGVCTVDRERCIGCCVCAQIRPRGAITMIRAEAVRRVPALAGRPA